jgi:hypothetical protein
MHCAFEIYVETKAPSFERDPEHSDAVCNAVRHESIQRLEVWRLPALSTRFNRTTQYHS